MATALALLPAPTPADIFHLDQGGTIEGEIVEQTDTLYTVRTVIGTVTIPRDAVASIESKASPFAEYDRRAESARDTATDQLALADWCEAAGLKTERRKHLRRALLFDPNSEAARRALGYVRVAGLWVEGRTVLKRAPREPAPPANPVPGRGHNNGADGTRALTAEEQNDQLISAIQGQWSRRVHAIRNDLLNASITRTVDDGRRMILAIQDPLAILPLSRILSEGNLACREVLVQLLTRFPQDEATMNLAALALSDRNHEVRRQSLLNLVRRSDPRVVNQFRAALRSGNDRLIRRAAEGLGRLQAQSAIKDLIPVLRATRRKTVEVPIRTYFGNYSSVFRSPTNVQLGASRAVNYTPVMGVASNGTLLYANSVMQRRNVTVFRSEVREALREITGVDFGFDPAAWSRWLEEQTP